MTLNFHAVRKRLTNEFWPDSRVLACWQSVARWYRGFWGIGCLERLVEEVVLNVSKLGAKVGLDRVDERSNKLVVALLKTRDHLLVLLHLLKFQLEQIVIELDLQDYSESPYSLHPSQTG
jgi:hypothetical protein